MAAAAALWLAPIAGFGQEKPAAPPAGQAAPDPGGGIPSDPGAQPRPPVLPAPPVVPPPGNFGPGLGGRDCEHERAPGTGV
jgi:hypothetical protein